MLAAAPRLVLLVHLRPGRVQHVLACLNMFWHVFKILAFCLSFVNSCVNPLALYFISRQFRRYYDRYLFCCCRRQQDIAGEHAGAALLATGPQHGGRRGPANLGGDSTGSSRPHERVQMTVVDMAERYALGLTHNVTSTDLL